MAVPPAVGSPQKSADIVHTRRLRGSGSKLPWGPFMGTRGIRRGPPTVSSLHARSKTHRRIDLKKNTVHAKHVML